MLLPAQQKDYFGHSNQGENYDKFRPQYPQEFFELILKNLSTRSRRNYLDVACGTGQLLFKLSSNFQFNLGIDISPIQIDVTNKKIEQNNSSQNVQAMVCDAHQLASIAEEKGIPQQYDLITIGQALHWFDVPRFLNEVSQNLMKQFSDSMFAVTCYFCKGFDFFLNENDVQEDSYIYNQFDDQIKDLFDCDRDQLAIGFRGYDFTQNFTELESSEVLKTVPCTVNDMCKYLQTFSAYNTLIEQNKDNADFIDPIITFKNAINKRVSEIENRTQKKQQYPIRVKISYHLRMFKKL